MHCCHADFLLNEQSDAAFSVGMPTFAFSRGCLAEARPQAREAGLKRIALFTDARLRESEHVAAVLDSIRNAGIEVTVFDEVVIEPTTASLKQASAFATEGRFDGYVS